ncbi:MAG: SPW repeat domain-containing protein [Solirubrobacteraceae bacterium]
MLRQGPIPRIVHGVIEYLAGALLIAAPFLLSFDSGAATAVSIVGGLVVLAVAASTEGPTGMVASIPTSVHFLLDFVFAGVLVASPFLFGFSGESAPTAFFIVLGVAHLLVTIGTRFGARGPRPTD